LAHTRIAFSDDPRPRSLLRSVLFTFLALWNVAAAFAVFYVSAGAAFEPPMTYPRALYFSMATITTLGDSTINPRTRLAFVLTAAQLVIGLYLIAVILARFVSLTDKGVHLSSQAPSEGGRDIARVLLAIRDGLEGLVVARSTGTVVVRIKLSKGEIRDVRVESEAGS